MYCHFSHYYTKREQRLTYNSGSLDGDRFDEELQTGKLNKISIFN